MKRDIMYGVEMYDRISDETFVYAYKKERKKLLEKKIDIYKSNLAKLPDITKRLNAKQREDFSKNQIEIHYVFEHCKHVIRNVKTILTDRDQRRYIEGSNGEKIILLDRLWSGF